MGRFSFYEVAVALRKVHADFSMRYPSLRRDRLEYQQSILLKKYRRSWICFYIRYIVFLDLQIIYRKDGYRTEV